MQSTEETKIMEQVEALASGEKSWFCIHYSDFCNGDMGSEYLPNYNDAVKLILSKPKNSKTAYQYWRDHDRLYTKPAGMNQAKWTNEHTGDGKGPY